MTIEQLLELRCKVREKAEHVLASGDREESMRLLLVAMRLGNIILSIQGQRQVGPPELQQ